MAQARIRPSRSASALGHLLSTGPDSTAVDVALVTIRIALAWIFIYYGGGKLFGAFNGPGIHNTALFFADTAHLRPGTLFAVTAGIIEFGGGIAVALGFASRLAGLALFGDQVIAMVTVTWGYGIGSLVKGGYEFNLTLAVLALAVVALGAGRLSVDNLIWSRVIGGTSGPDRSRSKLPPSIRVVPLESDPIVSAKSSHDGV